MNDINIKNAFSKEIIAQYAFSKKDFRRRLLRHIRIIYFITVPESLVWIISWLIMILNAYKNNDVVSIAGIITIVFVLISSNTLGLYMILFKNKLITYRNWSYNHSININNNYIKIDLKSPDGTNSEYYEFEIKKIKKEGDTYLIFKNNNNFIYVPAEYIDE